MVNTFLIHTAIGLANAKHNLKFVWQFCCISIFLWFFDLCQTAVLINAKFNTLCVYFIQLSWLMLSLLLCLPQTAILPNAKFVIVFVSQTAVLTNAKCDHHSVCVYGSIHHYILEKQSNGTYQIPEGKAFPGPLELIKHYQGQNYGFVTLPSKPCERGPHEQPLAFRGITYQQLEKALAKEARKMVCVLQVLVFCAPWTSTVISRWMWADFNIS